MYTAPLAPSSVPTGAHSVGVVSAGNTHGQPGEGPKNLTGTFEPDRDSNREYTETKNQGKLSFLLSIVGKLVKMGLEKRTLKIIVIVAITLVVLSAILGLLLGLLLYQRYVELEVWPRSEEYSWEQPLIQFRPSDTGSWHPWYKRINEFLKAYETTIPEDPPRAPCTTQNRGPLETHNPDRLTRSEACDLAMSMWKPCTADFFYGYNSGTPCVFLRLNHIHYWVPHPYNMSLSIATPPEMPRNIQQFMTQYPAQHFGDYVWVSCDGEFNSDKENIGTLRYIPVGPPGFPLSRLHTADKIPYANRNLPDQVPPPLIAVFFENPRREVLINVECRIWTRDIYYDKASSSRVGRARFELFINH